MSSMLLLSGGLDSLVLLAREVHTERKPCCVAFDYGQRHRRELQSAQEIADHYGIHLTVLKLVHAPLSGSALTGGQPLPTGLKWDDSRQTATVVPNRNMVFLSLAAALGVQLGCTTILFAAHRGDEAIYPDCRAEFVVAVDAAMRLSCGVGVEAPFLAMNKRDVVRLGRQLKAPLELSWSCYAGGEKPCGECGACLERADAGG